MESSDRVRVLKSLDEHELLRLAEQLIKIPSLAEDENEVAKFLGEFMEDNGFDVNMIQVEKNRYQPVAYLRGNQNGTSLMLNGHMDTDVIFYGSRDPFLPRVVGGRLYGHGIYNMKGGLAAMIMAAIALKKSGAQLAGDLVVTPVVGEIQGGVGTKCLLKRGIRADMAIVPEPFQEAVCTVHAGATEIAVSIRGKSEHISAPEAKGVDAMQKAAKVLNALYRLKFQHKPDPRLPRLPRMIVGSMIAGHGEDYALQGAAYLVDNVMIILDIRFLPGMDPDRDVARLLEKLKQDDPSLEYELKSPPDDFEKPGIPYRNFRLAFPPHDLPVDKPIVKIVAKNHKEVTGEPPIVGAIPPNHPAHRHMYSGDDDAHLWREGIPALCYGTKSGYDGPDQYVEIDSMVRICKVMALSAYDVCVREKS